MYNFVDILQSFAIVILSIAQIIYVNDKRKRHE